MSWRFAVVLAAMAAAPAAASPRTDPTAGRAVFTGAATPHATSLELNPAAMGLALGTEVYLSAETLIDRFAIDRAALDIDTGALSDGPAPLTEYTFAPGGTLVSVYRPSPESRITLGAGLRLAPAEKFIERNELRYHVYGGYHRTVTPLTIGASLRITGRVHIGVSVSAQRTALKLRYSRDTALEAGRDPARGIASDCGGAPCGVENPLAAEHYEVDVDSGWFSTEILTANLGATVRIANDVWLGVGYHTPPGLAIENELTGVMNVRRAPRDGGEQLVGVASVYVSEPVRVDAEIRARVSGVVDVHAGGRWEHLKRFQSYDVRGYGSTLPGNNIPEWQPRPRGFHSRVALWAGAEQVERANPFVFGGRIGVQSSGLENDRTSPLTIAPASLTLDLGAQYRLAPSIVLQATYGLQYAPTVGVEDSAFDPRARLDCIDSGFDYSTPGCTRVRLGYAQPTAAGDYQRIEQAFRLAVRFERD